MHRRTVVWLAWGLWGAAATLAVASFVLSLANRAAPPTRDLEIHANPWTLAAGTLLVFAAPAALIIAHRPSNPIGWLLYAIGVTFGGAIVASQYGFYALVTHPGSLPAGLAMAWLGDSAGVATLGLAPLLVLLFPDGKVPSPGWRPLMWITIGAGLIVTGRNWAKVGRQPLADVGGSRNAWSRSQDRKL
jgi:hypothetical protein